MIRSKSDAQDFIIDLAHPDAPYQTPQGVYIHHDGRYGYRGSQDVATSWYSRSEFLAVVWRDRKELNVQEKEEMACAVSENK